MAELRLGATGGAWALRTHGSMPNLALTWLDRGPRVACLGVMQSPTRSEQVPAVAMVELTAGDLRRLAAAATELADRLGS